MKMKSTGGFTLVELIVVIAILAILAAVAVPAYTGYIKEANDTAILTELSAIQTAAQAACSLEGTSVATIKISTKGDITVTGADGEDYTDEIEDFYTPNASDLEKKIAQHSEYKGAGVTWENGAWAKATAETE